MKLKSLRPAVGVYGTVAKDGIVDVDADTAKKLLQTGRFVEASDADIKAAAAREIALVDAGAAPIKAAAEAEAQAKAETDAAKGKAKG